MPLKARPFKKLKDECLETLMECHERQIMNRSPCLATETKYAGELTGRNFLMLGNYVTQAGKTVVALYITRSGIEYLDSL